MDKERDPRLDKERDYERQHFSPGKHNKGFRRQWPRRKASAERAARHTVAQKLGLVSVDSAEEVDTAVAGVTRNEVRKWSILNLREWIARKKRGRAGSSPAGEKP
ncbi:MAG: hypothetical protein OET44_03725 [Gammaproteobacteria bacterium]|nr:hypothetical protein [Gammaproteobacteria bacterium]